MAITKTAMAIEVNETINTIVTAVQFDTQSRYLDVYLYDKGVPIDLTGHQVRIHVKRKGFTTQFEQGEITDATAGRCQFELKNKMLQEIGTAEAQISIWNSGAEILSTKVFKILVTESIRNDEDVEASNEFGVLVVLFTEIQSALELMKEATNNYNELIDTYGEPGEMAAIYGVDTFWGMLECLAVAKAGVKSVQRGVTTEAGTISIGEVNVEKTVIHSVSKGSAGTVAARGTLTTAAVTATTNFRTNTSTSAIYEIDSDGEYYWEGSGSLSTTIPKHTSTLSGGTTDLIVAEYSAVLTSSTTIECDGPVEWQLVEYY